MRDYQGNLVPERLEGWEMGPAPLDPARILEIKNSRIEKILGAKTPRKNVCEIIAYRTNGERLLDSPVMAKEELEALPESALVAEVDKANAKIRANNKIALGDMTLQEFKNLEAQLKSFEEEKSAFIHEALIRDEKVIAEFKASSNLDALELLYKEFDKRYDDLSYQASKYRRGRQTPSWLSSQLKEAKEKTLTLKEKIAKIKEDLSDLRDSLYDQREKEAPKMSKELLEFKELVEFLDINFN